MFSDADRYLRTGIAYCADHDLDPWRQNMSASLRAGRARPIRRGGAILAEVIRHPDASPLNRVVALAVAGALADRRGDDDTALDEALPLAIRSGDAQELVPVAAARVEAAWIAGRLYEITTEIDRAWPAAIAFPQPCDLGELSWWLQAAGEHRAAPHLAGPAVRAHAGRRAPHRRQ